MVLELLGLEVVFQFILKAKKFYLERFKDLKGLMLL